MKMKRSNIVIIVTAVLIYSVILAACGIFGETMQNAISYFIHNILPIIGIIFGYFLTIFVPLRIMQAAERNRQAKKEYENEQKLQEHIIRNKELENNILSVLKKGDTV